MKRILNYLKPILEDEKSQPSRKRLLEIICITDACILTTITTVMKYNNPDMDIATITMLIAPLFATGLAYSGLTTYYQNKTNDNK